MNFKHKHLDIIALFIPIALAVICLFSVVNNNSQAAMPVPMPLEFIGEYSYDGENWYTVDKNVPLSAMKGDLILKGHFDNDIVDGAAVNFLKNHIGIEIYINGELRYIDAVAEFCQAGIDHYPSMCGKVWETVVLSAIYTDDIVEIHLTNTHRSGNSTAYNDFLETLCGGPPDPYILAENLKGYGTPFRTAGGLMFILSLILIGGAVAAYAMRVQESIYIMKLGLLTLFVSGYVAYDTIDACFFSDIMAVPTHIIQLCKMFIVHCTGWIALEAFTGKRRKIARAMVIASEVLIIILVCISSFGAMLIYDTGICWTVFQMLFCPVMLVMCVVEYAYNENRSTIVLVSSAVIFATVIMDTLGVGETIITSGVCFKAAFAVLFVVYIVIAARDVVRNRHASILAEKLQKELEESRISIMLSQIQPHFLYNAITAIQVLCGRQPLKAKDALGEFALYLRGNIDSLSSNAPIPFYKELQHVESYLALEKLRFEEQLQIVYDIQVQDFYIPSLTLQPLVENAVKHGIFAREEGGTVTVKTYRQDDKIIISVTDDGVGFDENAAQDGDRLHIGIKNVRSRLEKMVGGRLEITSEVDKGTTATITLDR